MSDAMTLETIDLEMMASLLDGHVDVRRRPGALQPLRYPFADTLFLDPFTRWVASCPAGVRLRMLTDATEIRIASTQRSIAGPPDAVPRPVNYELYVDGQFRRRQAASGGALMTPEGGLMGDEQATVTFEGMPAGDKQNVAMAFDEANHRLFIVTRNPGKLIVMNSDDGRVIANLPAVGMVDDAVYDAQHKRIYLAGDQFLDVFEQKDPDHYALLAKIPGAFRAKTGILVPELNKYYLAVPHHEGKEAEVRVYEIQP